MPEFTRKVARKHSRPHIAAIKERLVDMAGHWGDLDQTVIYATEGAGAASSVSGADHPTGRTAKLSLEHRFPRQHHDR